MTPSRIAMVAASAVLAAVALSSCAMFERPNGSVVFNAPFSYKDSFVSGTFTPTGAGSGQIRGKVTKGSFKATLPFRLSVSRLARAGKVRVTGGGRQLLRGSYVAKYDGESDDNTGTGDLAGTVLLKLDLKGFGLACFGTTESLSQNRTSGAGSFHSLGGTEAAARLRATGNFDETITATSDTRASSVGHMHGVAKLAQSVKGLSPACKRLQSRI